MGQRSHQFISYWRYLRAAKGLKDMHSPFVHSFVDELLYKKKKKAFFFDLDAQLKSLKSNQRTIPVADAGAGSIKGNRSQKRISDIARSAVSPNPWLHLLANMMALRHPKYIVELGTSLGMSAAYVAKSLPSSEIHSIEASQEIMELAKQTHGALQIENVTLHLGTFDDILPSLLTDMPAVDAALVDGNHTYEATVRYFKILLPKMQAGSFMLFDDIYWSEGMTRAWEEIKAHPDVVLTLDLYRWGLVFFPKNTEKQNFVLKTGIYPWST